MFPEMTEDELADRMQAFLDKYPREAAAIALHPEEDHERLLLEFLERHKDDRELAEMEQLMALAAVDLATIH